MITRALTMATFDTSLVNVIHEFLFLLGFDSSTIWKAQKAGLSFYLILKQLHDSTLVKATELERVLTVRRDKLTRGDSQGSIREGF